MHVMAGLTFPPIGELLDWKKIAPGGFNKTTLIDVLAVVATVALFVSAGRKKAMVPRGTQNIGEMLVEFINGEIIMQTMGPEGLNYLPFLMAIFCFVFFCNITEIIPVLQFPADARMANPLILAVIVWLTFNVAGIKRQGFFTYLKNSCVPPGVPKVMLILVVPIEFLQLVIIRPLTLAIRLFANMLAGHLLLVTFALLGDALIFHNSVTVLVPVAVLPGIMEVVIMLFEVLIATLQAYIFTILTGVYVASSLHPEH